MDTTTEVRVKPNSYQPKKSELEEPVRIAGTPENLRATVMKSVHVVDDKNA